MQGSGSVRYWLFFEKGLLAAWGRQYSECEYIGKSVYGRSCPVVFLNQGGHKEKLCEQPDNTGGRRACGGAYERGPKNVEADIGRIRE